MYPGKLAKILKSYRKIWKSAQLLPFDRWCVFTTFQKILSGGRLTIKCLRIPTYPQCLQKRNPDVTFLVSRTSQSWRQILLIQTSCTLDTAAPPVSPDPRINNDADDEEWTPNLPFNSNKPMWNDEESEGDIDSKNEEDFLDKIVEEEKPGVNPRKYRNKGWYVALMQKNQLILCHLLLQYWGWAKYQYR